MPLNSPLLSHNANDDMQQLDLQLNFFNNKRRNEYKKIAVSLRASPIYNHKSIVNIQQRASGTTCDCTCD
jgi:hypothetical protein